MSERRQIEPTPSSNNTDRDTLVIEILRRAQEITAALETKPAQCVPVNVEALIA